jgi:hypothetical protein
MMEEKFDLNSTELLAIARIRRISSGRTFTICGIPFRMCTDQTGSEFVHKVEAVREKSAA